MKCLLLCNLLLSVGTQCRADVVLSLSPSHQDVSLGSQASIDVKIAGLGGGTSLGVYDIDVGFDSTLLSFFSITWGNQLDLFGLGDIQSTTAGSGTINLFELSLESAADLNTLQAASFRLATLTFDTLAIGSNSPITLSFNALGDAFGNALSAEIHGASVSINAVPEPNGVILVATVLVIIVFVGRRVGCNLR